MARRGAASDSSTYAKWAEKLIIAVVIGLVTGLTQYHLVEKNKEQWKSRWETKHEAVLEALDVADAWVSRTKPFCEGG